MFVVVIKKSRLLLLLLLGINGWVGLLRGTHNKGFGWGAVVGDVVGSSGTRPRAVGLGEGTGCGEMKKKKGCVRNKMSTTRQADDSCRCREWCCGGAGVGLRRCEKNDAM